MNFFELKKKAEKDGMDIMTNTKKKDIEAFYANMEKKKDLGEFKTVTVINGKCPVCGIKLYHGLCTKHGRMV